MNKILIIKPTISLINFIDNPTNTHSNNMIAIVDSGANIHLAKQSTTTMPPVIMSNEITTRLPDGSTMDSLHIATLQILGIINKRGRSTFFQK